MVEGSDCQHGDCIRVYFSIWFLEGPVRWLCGCVGSQMVGPCIEVR